ncbi:MAG: hypothetical protein AB8B63_20800 [Granulosicoccus sp.]
MPSMSLSALSETGVSEQLRPVETGGVSRTETESMQACQWQAKDSLHMLPEPLTAFATVNEEGEELLVTDLMISSACEQMDYSQLWPLPEQISAIAVEALPSVKAKILQFPSQRR